MSPWSSDSLPWIARQGKVRLKPVDLIIVSVCSLAALALVGPCRWAPGALPSAVGFAVLALGPLVLRTLQATWPRQWVLSWVADFWLLPVVLVAHELLNPLVDAITPVLWDAQLATLEERLFGFQVSVLISNAVPPWLQDVLMVCYYGHFVWGFSLGVTLYLHKRTAAFDEFLLALGVFFAVGYSAYIVVPAIGPRLFLASSFPGPLQGVVVTPFLDSLMRTPIFIRDCFPSGHTGATLLVLFYAFRFSRRVFWTMLLPGIGLIVATLSGRFHYAVDLVAVLPVVVLSAGLAMALSRSSSRRGYTSERSMPVDAIVRP
ncbi:phosphatase PAP2 family protein [Hyalangium sp.]|uniref:phosphatase PAP2 family protein n=1 Tax=Hyalangium sp. TaxID=2028555 RepID=UPI002D5D0871|nr:phosphatase PAP2 family protein [Hyalangium sp.]HYH98694.1 phosphatase PAP2 family protein [Hyalangium sp.]